VSVSPRPERRVTVGGDAIARAGQEARADAFRSLAALHLDASKRLAHAILGDSSEAEDAVQDAFVRAWRGWSGLRDLDRFEPWFHRILVNTCRNRLRTLGRVRVDDISAEVALAQPGDAFANAQDREVVALALAGLDRDHRIVVVLRYYADLSVDQIAARTGVPSGTVKSRLHHALRRLHLALDGESAAEVSG
jgi:RNA polymerase sigma-70 factor (ECF subfamily)